MQPPSPSSRALAHTPRDGLFCQGFSEPPACGLGTGVAETQAQLGVDGSGSRCCDAGRQQAQLGGGAVALYSLFLQGLCFCPGRGMTAGPSLGNNVLDLDRAREMWTVKVFRSFRATARACQLCHGVCVRYLRVKIMTPRERKESQPGQHSEEGKGRGPRAVPCSTGSVQPDDGLK